MIDRALTDVGYEVLLVVDGEETIEQYTKAREAGCPFDAVILDLTVPGGMGGGEAIRKLLEIDPDAKVIASSGYSTDPVIADNKKHGFSGVVIKPYRVSELRGTLHNVLAETRG
ncbi:MAG: response regulator [Dehalococcoidales bacterium]|nr:MAG: response regulator [Dehalococcoidales bacterium]